MDFNLQLAAQLAQASADAYHTATIDAPGTDTQVLAADLNGDLCFAFRGTSDFRDALTDANILLKGAPDIPAREGRLHSGVVRSVESVIPQLAKICREAPDRKIYFTGHSLGGGCAPLAAYLLANEGFDVAGVITFAGMRFCDPDFKVNYNKLLGDRTLRVVAQYDVVPHLPLPGWFLPYRHVGTEVYISSPNPDAVLAKPKLKISRRPLEVLIADGITIAKAVRLARSFYGVTLARDTVAMHSIARYQRLLNQLA